MQVNPKTSAELLLKSVLAPKPEFEPLYSKLNLSLQKIKLKEREKGFRKELDSLSKNQIIESIITSLSENPSIFSSIKNAIKNLPKLENEEQLVKQSSIENVIDADTKNLAQKDTEKSVNNYNFLMQESHKTEITVLQNKLDTLSKELLNSKATVENLTTEKQDLHSKLEDSIIIHEKINESQIESNNEALIQNLEGQKRNLEEKLNESNQEVNKNQTKILELDLNLSQKDSEISE